MFGKRDGRANKIYKKTDDVMLWSLESVTRQMCYLVIDQPLLMDGNEMFKSGHQAGTLVLFTGGMSMASLNIFPQLLSLCSIYVYSLFTTHSCMCLCVCAQVEHARNSFGRVARRAAQWSSHLTGRVSSPPFSLVSLALEHRRYFSL